MAATSAAQMLMLGLPSQSIALDVPAVPSTLLMSPESGEYISCQMMPTSASDSITGMKNTVW